MGAEASSGQSDTRPEGIRIAMLERSVAELKLAVEARDAFIAVVAQELRNPMTPILGQVELLLSGMRSLRYSAEQVEHRLGRIHRAIRHCWNRVGVLLEVARLNRDRLRLRPEAIDLAVLLRETAASFADLAGTDRVALAVHVPDSLPGAWDRLALEQIVDNLVSNALKHGGGTPVTLSAELSGEQVRVRVRDHGGGVAPEDRARIFERFECAVGRSERRSGFGIGLWLVGHLASAMDGSVDVENVADGGALFTVTLPQYSKDMRP